ncbi:MAG: hypothetical protein WED00_01200 [Aquisalimonadaceae bacterium]
MHGNSDDDGAYTRYTRSDWNRMHLDRNPSENRSRYWERFSLGSPETFHHYVRTRIKALA